MQCLACGADNKMLLMDVVRDDTMKVPAFDHHIYRCSACRHIARRLVFRRAKKTDHSFAGYTYINRQALEGARCSPQNLGESGRDEDRPQRESSGSEDRYLDQGG
jgi:hypothetical protein